MLIQRLDRETTQFTQFIRESDENLSNNELKLFKMILSIYFSVF
jgi:hypothetical protein